MMENSCPPYSVVLWLEHLLGIWEVGGWILPLAESYQTSKIVCAASLLDAQHLEDRTRMNPIGWFNQTCKIIPTFLASVIENFNPQNLVDYMCRITFS